MFDSLFNLHFVVEHIYEVLRLLAPRFRVKLAISFYTVVCYHCNAYPREERYKKESSEGLFNANYNKFRIWRTLLLVKRACFIRIQNFELSSSCHASEKMYYVRPFPGLLSTFFSLIKSEISEHGSGQVATENPN